MADVTLTPQSVDKSGAEPSYTELNNVDTYHFRNDAKTLVYFKNTGGLAVVTMLTPVTVATLEVENPTLSIPTGERVVAFQPTSAFNDLSGNASFTNDTPAEVSVAILKVA